MKIAINLQNYTRRDEEYIEKRINALSAYNAYWCFFELRSQGRFPSKTILKDDAICKLQLIKFLKNAKYSPRSLDALLEISAVNSIPLSYVKWFYDDKRAALWLNMVLKKRDILHDSILIESEITNFIHNVIFNKNLLVTGKELREGDDDYNESLISWKKISLTLLKTAYIRSKVSSKDTRWLISRDSIKVNHLYRYMQKTYDLNNLNSNKTAKKFWGLSDKGADKTAYKQALVCADSINFDEADTTSRLNHMLASLDYWMFDTYWFDREGTAVDEVKTANRTTFLENMYAAWISKTKRARDKKIKDKGLELTSTNKKILKLIAKNEGKSHTQMLNDIVESYCPKAYYEVEKKLKAANRLSVGNYVQPYTDTFETAQSIKDKGSSNELLLAYDPSDKSNEISFNCDLSESVESVSDVEDVNVDVALDAIADASTDTLHAVPDNIAIDSVVPKNISMTANSESVARSNETEHNTFANFDHRIANQKADNKENPFEKNAEILRNKNL